MKKEFSALLVEAQETINEGIFIIDRSGRIADVNDFVLEYLGYTYEEITGMTVWELDPNFNTEDSFTQIRDEGVLYFETLHRHKDGRIIASRPTKDFTQQGLIDARTGQRN